MKKAKILSICLMAVLVCSGCTDNTNKVGKDVNSSISGKINNTTEDASSNITEDVSSNTPTEESSSTSTEDVGGSTSTEDESSDTSTDESSGTLIGEIGDNTEKDTIIKATTENVDVSELWSLSNNNYSIANDVGNFNAVDNNGKDINVIVRGDTLPKLFFEAVKDGIRFIPTYYIDEKYKEDLIQTHYIYSMYGNAEDQDWYEELVYELKKEYDDNYMDYNNALKEAIMEKFSDEDKAEWRKEAEELYKDYVYYAITELEFYDKEGNALVDIKTEDDLFNYKQELKKQQKIERLNAVELKEKEIKLSSIETDKLYFVQDFGNGFTFINDTGELIGLSFIKYDNFEDDWETEIVPIPNKTFSDEQGKYQLSYYVSTELDTEKQKVYIKLDSSISTDKVKNDIISRDDCIKVSELSSEVYDTFAKKYVYNDTDNEVSVYYTIDKNFEKENANVVMFSGDLIEIDWFYQKDLYIGK